MPDDADGVRPADLSWLRRLAQLRRLFTQLPTKVRVVLVALVIVVEVAIGWRIGLNAALPAYLFFGAVGSLVALNDASERRIPNAVLLPAYPIAAALLVLASALLGKQPGLSGIEQKTPKTWAKNRSKKTNVLRIRPVG